MEIKNKTPDLQKVFEQRWKANDYNQNGIKENIEHQNELMNKMFNIKPKEAWRKDILESNSVNGQVKNLQNRMDSLKSFNQNKFR